MKKFLSNSAISIYIQVSFPTVYMIITLFPKSFLDSPFETFIYLSS